MSERGVPGKTHCGSWIPVSPVPEYAFRTRLVCAEGPQHPRRPHRTTDGWCWSANSPVPYRQRSRKVTS